MTNATQEKIIIFFQGFLAGILPVFAYRITVFSLENEVFQKLIQNQTFLTVISGVTVFILGQVIQSFILKPIVRHKESIGVIEYQLNYFQKELENFFTTKTQQEITKLQKTTNEIRQQLKQCTSSFITTYKIIPFKTLFVIFGVLLSQRSVRLVSGYLSFIANQDTFYFTRSDLTGMGLSKTQRNEWDNKTIDSNLEVISALRKKLKIYDSTIDTSDDKNL